MQRFRQLWRARWREVVAWTLIVLGAIAAVVGWIGVSGKDLEALQLPYLASGGIGGLILTAVGAALLISADVRADRERAARLEAEVLELQTLVQELSTRLPSGNGAGPTTRRDRPTSRAVGRRGSG